MKQPARIFGSVIATASVAALVAVFTIPVTQVAAPAVEEERAAAQMLNSMNVVAPSSDAYAFGAVEVQAVPQRAVKFAREKGLIDTVNLTSTKLRYPFEQQVAHTSGFGYRVAPVAGFHDAQDFGAPAGTPILIIGDGVVVQAGWENDGCGWGLKVQHNVDGDDVTSRYCHMEQSSHSYKVGDLVSSGDIAGRVGNTGLSFGPHLHLELRLNGEPTDPLPLIAKHSA